MVINESVLRKYCTVVLVLFPLLGLYGVFSRSVTFADLAIIPAIGVIVLFGLMDGFQVSENLYICFAAWFLFTALIISPFWKGLFSAGTITSILQNTIYFATVILIAPTYFDCKLAFKVYSNVVLLLSGILFIQVALHFVTGSITPWVLNSRFFPAVYVPEDFFTGGYLAMIQNTSYRPSSLFSEPALFAQYVTPCLILNLYKKNKNRKSFVTVLLVTVSVLLAGSANGIVYVLTAWGLFGIHFVAEKVANKQTRFKVWFVVLMFLVIALLPKVLEAFSGLMGSLFVRFGEILDLKGISSGSMRVVRGWQIFAGLSIPEKIFGIGTGNIIPYLNLHPHIVTMFVKAYNGYMSGLSSIFVNSGIIGGTLYLLWWFRRYKSGQTVVKSLLAYLMIYLLASSSFNTVQFMLTMVIIITLRLGDNNEYFKN